MIKQLPNEMWGDTLKNRITDGALVSVIDMSQLYYLRFSDWIPVEEVLKQILELSKIEYAHPPAEAASLADQPNDPLFGDQWNLQRILAEQAWEISQGSSGVAVAIIESERLPYKLHPDLENNWDPNKGEQRTGDGDHGTRVAGIIGAETNNETGIASLGWNLKMSRYAFGYAEPPITLVDAIAAAVADTNRVINCSFVTIRLARVTLPGNIACSFRFFHSYPSVENAITNAINMGVVVVGGAGNSLAWHYLDGLLPDCTNLLVSSWEFPLPAPPAAYANVIAVSATGENDLWAEGQNLSDPLQNYNHGNWVDVAAPGMNVLTTSMPSGYSDAERGTSFSAPHVSALAGLILSIDSNLLPSAVREIITSTADKVDSNRSPYTNGFNDRLGYGRINAYRALSKANGPPAAPGDVSWYGNPGQHPTITWAANTEIDLLGYNVHSYTDVQTYVGGGTGVYYRPYHVKAIDVALQESNPSANTYVPMGGLAPWKASSRSPLDKPAIFALHAGYPNPFNPSTQINYDLPENGFVSLAVYDVLGRKVAELLKGYQEAGYHSTTWNAAIQASGVYVVRFTASDEFGRMNKLMLIR